MLKKVKKNKKENSLSLHFSVWIVSMLGYLLKTPFFIVFG
jgi:hypothetical protein